MNDYMNGARHRVYERVDLKENFPFVLLIRKENQLRKHFYVVILATCANNLAIVLPFTGQEMRLGFSIPLLGVEDYPHARMSPVVMEHDRMLITRNLLCQTKEILYSHNLQTDPSSFRPNVNTC